VFRVHKAPQRTADEDWISKAFAKEKLVLTCDGLENSGKRLVRERDVILEHNGGMFMFTSASIPIPQVGKILKKLKKRMTKIVAASDNKPFLYKISAEGVMSRDSSVTRNNQWEYQKRKSKKGKQ